MAKVSLTKLGLTKNQGITKVYWNEQEIEVKNYLPVNDKLILISNVINSSMDGNNFKNPVRVEVFTALEILYAYTNINFTDKQKEDPCKLFDSFKGTGLLDKIFAAIPDGEFCELMTGIHHSVDAVYEYRNSILGVLDATASDYNNVNLDLQAIQDKLTDPESLALLKELAPLLGPTA